MALSPEEVGKWISKNIDTEKIPEEGWDKFTEAVDWAYNRACEDCAKRIEDGHPQGYVEQELKYGELGDHCRELKHE